MRTLCIVLVVGLLSSCAVRRETSSERRAEHRAVAVSDTLVRQTSDTLALRHDARRHATLTESHTLTYAALPAERVTLRVPIAQFDALPVGAAYVAGEGRTRIEARREGDNLLLTATVDSLPREVVEHHRVEERADVVSDSLHRHSEHVARLSAHSDSLLQMSDDKNSHTLRRRSPTLFSWSLLAFVVVVGWLYRRHLRERL